VWDAGIFVQLAGIGNEILAGRHRALL
jgi:hypothetical protein